jgi:hypothetical protein
MATIGTLELTVWTLTITDDEEVDNDATRVFVNESQAEDVLVLTLAKLGIIPTSDMPFHRAVELLDASDRDLHYRIESHHLRALIDSTGQAVATL